MSAPAARRLRIKVAHGQIETLIEMPDAVRFPTPQGLALIAHPHPLHGGTLDNKVTWTLARAALACGLIAVRPNFRGVGASSGTFDHGQGETDDLLAIAAAVSAYYPDIPWTLLGFSFGGYVQHRVAQHLPATQAILVAPAVTLYAFDALPLPTTIIQGDADEVVPYAAVQAYAARQAIPLITLPECGHFFHGRLRELQTQVEALLCPSRSN